jgi:hypothetical protein
MVLVSHSKEFVFLKTRKTAGTSFEMMLEPWCTPPSHIVNEKVPEIVSEYGIVGARLNKQKDKPYWRNHIGARHVKAYLGDERWDRYLKIASVRNPFSRAISQFYWQFVWQKQEVPDGLDANRVAFRNYVFSKMLKPDTHIAHINGAYVLDDAFRLEYLDEDLDRIGKRLGLSLSRDRLPKTKENAGTKPDIDFLSLFTPDVEEEIRKKQAWVFKHFGYSPHARDARL